MCLIKHFVVVTEVTAVTPSSSPNQSQLSLPGLIIHPDGVNSGQDNNSSNKELISTNKNRSHSTTSLYGSTVVQSPSGKRLARDRKTVCSLHPMTASEFSHLEALHLGEDTRLVDDSSSEADGCLTPAPGSIGSSSHDSRRGSEHSTRYLSELSSRNVF